MPVSGAIVMILVCKMKKKEKKKTYYYRHSGYWQGLETHLCLKPSLVIVVVGAIPLQRVQRDTKPEVTLDVLTSLYKLRYCPVTLIV